ncbi:hypothetical protein CERSUDRAFT_124205, partial [Gelatoporia subvermispora B]
MTQPEKMLHWWYSTFYRPEVNTIRRVLNELSGSPGGSTRVQCFVMIQERAAKEGYHGNSRENKKFEENEGANLRELGYIEADFPNTKEAKINSRLPDRRREITKLYEEELETWNIDQTRDLMPRQISSKEVEEYKTRVKRVLVHVLRVNGLSERPDLSQPPSALPGAAGTLDTVADDDDLDAILAQPTSLFRCIDSAHKRTKTCQDALAYPAIHAHWRAAHTKLCFGRDPHTHDARKKNYRSREWVPAYVTSASDEIRIAPQVLAALELPSSDGIRVEELDAMVRDTRI